MLRPFSCLVLALFLCRGVDAASAAIATDDTSYESSDTVTVTVAVANAPAFAGWGTLVRFDPKVLAFESQSAGDFATFVPDSRTPEQIDAIGEVRVGGFGFSNDKAGSGNLVRLTFRILASEPTTTTLQTVAYGESEPFGTRLTTGGGDGVIPDLTVPAVTIQIGEANQPQRRITIDAGGRVSQIVISPADGDVSSSGSTFIFQALDPAQDYLLQLFGLHNG